MSIAGRLLPVLDRVRPAPVAHAHCDGPCGVYDPASARIAAEAVQSMTKKLVALDLDADPLQAGNTFSRYVAIKEEEAEKVKRELAILWHDYFKPEHLENHPDLHTTFWMAIKQASTCKTTVSEEAAEKLMSMVEEIHHLFWASKGQDVPWIRAS